MRAVIASVAVAACLSCSEAFAPHAGSCTTSRRAQLTVAAGAAPSRSVGVSAARRGARRAGATISMGAGAATADAAYAPPDAITPEHPLRVILAGGGVGGLLAAKYLKQSGFDVTVFEKTDSFKRFGGPIQLASNALSTIKAIDPKLFESLMKKFTFTGVRTNGIMDGLRTEWYTKFDAITAAADMRGLPYTGVVDRPDLQAILLEDLGENVVHNANTVCGYRNTDNGVEVLLEGGKTMHGDVLIGADGIWSQVRAQMWDEPVKNGKNSGATYSGYTVFAGETIYEPRDYWDVGYKVYIGPGQYFVTSDIGQGRMQWYAFLALPAGTKARDDNILYLKDRFKGWSEDISEALDATSNNDVEQRDLYDRRPSVMRSWSDGHVTLMGDACHPMMPNLGQGGCQAMEDGYVLTNMLKEVTRRSEIPSTLQKYYRTRIARTAIVQGLSRIASDLIINQFDTPARMTMSPFKMDMPGGMKSIMTSLMQPVLPLIFWAQFNYLYSFCPTSLTEEERAALVTEERARARKDAELVWAKAKADGTFAKGYNRELKQFT
ncbi:zeaxanthin epoxidase chloroplast precursor [Tribonema minus]|uniref:Zeaxanthin epoxidase chloroplast n=1 Tax=Tribonema minus TaxID=303371 RepID=A0A835YX74_9STRA|nr:zeaxanthin epoxidase chloroplast precursor [Tribonema minus]